MDHDEHPSERIARLTEERRAWSPETRRAELDALDALPPEDDEAWNDDATWQRAELLVVHADSVAPGDMDAVARILSKMCLGDPGELMRSVLSRLESAALDEDRVARVCLLALRSGEPGARWWALQELGRLGGVERAGAVVDALSDPVHEVGLEACAVLIGLAARHPVLRPLARAELSALSSTPLASAAARQLEELRAHEQAELLEREALDAAQSGQPLRMTRTVRRCGIQFRSACPLAWSALEPTPDPDVRHCHVCAEAVYFCRSDEETIARAIADQCIAREEPDASEQPRVVLGRPERPESLTARHLEARRLSARERGIREVIGIARSIPRRCPQCTYPLPSYRKTCQVCGLAV